MADGGLHPDDINLSVRSIDSFFNPLRAELIFVPFLCCSISGG